jgi:hypothetical protein
MEILLVGGLCRSVDVLHSPKYKTTIPSRTLNASWKFLENNWNKVDSPGVTPLATASDKKTAQPKGCAAVDIVVF